MDILIAAFILILAISGWIFWPRQRESIPLQQNTMVCILTTDKEGNAMRLYRRVKSDEHVKTISDSYTEKQKQDRLQGQ
ncbi:hypothetical protein EH243_03875 [Amphritea opalescens]|uniref:Uncharacterized protein n=1 Tax=Amphritea opalescens TaxID=2490544 RepID=A0A430KV16_9GAMM|nr:hypothetical protein [Amphritea opalescens]RTE67347.1 hypothetical protein EH243_03875 [Amphritea opalescens]